MGTVVFDNSANFAYTGSTQIFVKPKNVNTIFCQVKAGGGGGSSNSTGGGGAYVFTKYNFLNKDISYNVYINVGSGGKALPTKTGGVSVGGQGELTNGGDGTTFNSASSGGGGGMSSIFFQQGNTTIIKIIAGGGGGGGSSGGAGGVGGQTGNTGGGDGGVGGNQDLIGDGGLGGQNGGVNGFNYVDSSNNSAIDISNNGIYSFIGGGGGNGGTYAGGGGGAGYGGGASGKEGGGGGGGSLSNGDTVYYIAGQGGAGGAINSSGQDGSIRIGWYEIFVLPPSIVSMFMLNPQHTARSIYNAPYILPLPENITSIQTQSSAYSYNNQIIIDNDEEIYFTSVDGYLHKYDHNYNFIWNFKITNYTFIGTPVITNTGTLYLCATTTTGLPYLYAIIEDINVSTGITQGKIKWNAALDGNCVGSPIIDASGNIYVGTTNGSIYKFLDGSIAGVPVWKYPSTAHGYPITGTLAIDAAEEKLVYTATNSTINTSYLYLIDISNTTPIDISSASIMNDTYNSPSIRPANGDIYVTTPTGKLYGFNSSLAPQFTIDVNDIGLSNIAIGSDDYIYFTSKNYLNMVDTTNEVLEWKYYVENNSITLYNSTPTIDASNNVYFGTNTNYLFCVNGVSKLHLWEYEVTGSIYSMPVICSHTDIKVITSNGKLYNFIGNGTPIINSPQAQMFMLDKRHTGKSSYTAPTTIPTIKWTSSINIQSGNLYILPTIAINSNGTKLYLGSNNGILYSLNTANGNLVWSANLVTINNSRAIDYPHAIYTSPLISPTDGTIYVGSNNGYFHAVDPSGNIKDSFMVDYPFQSSPMMDSSGAIFFGAGNKLYSMGYNGLNLYLRWLDPYVSGGTILSSPALDETETVYFGSNDGFVYGINKTTGNLIWQYDANITQPNPDINPIYTSPSVDVSNNVIIGNGSYMNGELYYLDGSNNGIKLWSNTYNPNIGPFYNTVAINDSTNTLYLSTIAYVYAINRIDGAEKWKYRKSNCYYTTPLIDSNNNIIFCSVDARTTYGYVHMVTDNGNDYTENWNLQISNTANERLSPPVIGSDGTIYINSTANKVYAINV